jgi:hypothetical protein
MKHTVVFVLVLFLGLTNVVTAQNTNSAKPVASNTMSTATLPVLAPMLEPEWTGQIAVISDGKLIDLEHQKPSATMKIKGLGFGGGTTAFVYTGTNSPIRVDTSTAEFVVRLEGSENPALFVVLDRLQQDAKKGTRFIVVDKVGSLVSGFKTTTNSDNGTVELTFKKYGNCVKITTTLMLTPGEYAFRTKTGITYMFGVN